MVAKADLQKLSASARADAMGDQIARLAAQMTTGEHALIHAIADFDSAGAFVEHGALTTVQWLGYRVGMSPATASEKLRVGHALQVLPEIDGAFAAARVSYSKVRALTRVATPENEASLLELARCATAAELERICRKYRATTCEATPADAKVNRFVRVQQTDDGSTRLVIQLPPDEGARLLAALDVAKTQLDAAGSSAEGEGTRHDRADAAVALAESFFGSGARPRRCGSPHEVVVHVDAEALAGSSAEDPEAIGHIENAGGQGVGPETARRLCCDASISALVTDADGQTLAAGRKSRTVPAPKRRALTARAEHRCQFPGCTHRHYLDAHHIEHWAHGGETELDNLVLLCRRHHVFVHELGWKVELSKEGARSFLAPNGRRLEASPESSAEDLTELVDAAERPELDALGLRPLGPGGPVDYVYIIDVMMQRGRSGLRASS